MDPHAPEFELVIASTTGPDQVEVEAVVRSEALDRSMHPDGTVEVYIFTKRATADGKSGVVLDSFQLHSLQQYLRNQDDIRQSLERELAADQEQVDPAGEPVRGYVWSWAEVRGIELRLRDLNNPEANERLRGIGFMVDEYQKFAPPPESPATRTFFVLRLKCDWRMDHPLVAIFRDGKFVSLR